MEITNEQRIQAEERANETQLFLYAEPEAGKQLRNIATKFNLTERNTYYIFSQLVGDVVLGFYKHESIPDLIAYFLPHIQGAQKIGLEAEIKMFLYPLLEVGPSTVDTPPQHNVPFSNEIKETQHSIDQLPMVHTMAQDMQQASAPPTPPEVPMYRSPSQDDLLRRPTPPSNTAPTDLSPSPHWETDKSQ